MEQTQESVELTSENVHPNLKFTSHSSLILLHRCPRKYELYKMLPRFEEVTEEDLDDEILAAALVDEKASIHLDFGTLVGYGVQTYLETQNIDETLFKMFLSWDGDFTDDYAVTKKKSFYHGCWAIRKFAAEQGELIGSSSQLLLLGERSSAELGYTMQLPDGFSYRGKLDSVLYNFKTKAVTVLEVKTTSAREIHEAQYINSSQGLSYSLVLDTIMKQAFPEAETLEKFSVLYLIYKASSMEWQALDPVSFTLERRVNFIESILMDVADVKRYAEAKHFPMRGESCFEYFKPCEYYGVCQISNSSILPSTPTLLEDKEGEFPYAFSLLDLLKTQSS